MTHQLKSEPGMIGYLGTVLGNAQINIASMEVGRTGPRDKALMAVTVDDRPSQEVLDKLGSNDKMRTVILVDLNQE